MSTRQTLLLRFLEESGPILHGLLTRLMLDEQAAEEITQDLFIKLIEIKDLEKVANLRAYACRIAINLAFDWRRKQTLFEPIPYDHPDNRVMQVHLQLIQNEQIHHILDAVEKLSEQARECIVLRYIEQMDYEHIAKLLEKSPQQVRALCSKGIQRIRQILNVQHAPFYKEAINE